MIKIIKVDKEDNKTGEIEKLEAHKKGILHRAFSIFIFNKKGEMLLQKRADEKYHGGGLWSNTCCSHPTKEGDIVNQAKKRLIEEMGFETELEKVGLINYKAKVGDLTENEMDHIFFGTYRGSVDPNPEEVSDYRWVSISDLEKEMEEDPEKFTPWFKIIYTKLKKSGQIK